MSPYEKRLQDDLDKIQDRIQSVAGAVDTALKDSVHAFMTRDRRLANETALNDLPINREIRAIDRQCHEFIARHLPSSRHLRFVSAVMRLTIELERIGDYAVTVAREASQIDGDLPEGILRDVELLAEQSRQMLKQAVKAFGEGNADMARGTKAMESQVDVSFHKVFEDLTDAGDKHRIDTHGLFALLSVFNALERVSDQAKNICEEAIFFADGERKPPKTYRVLFIDADGAKLAPTALAFSRKAYPGSLAARAAASTPAEGIDKEVVGFLEAKGHATDDLAPTKLDLTEDEVGAYHVVVGLDCEPRAVLGVKPFHTAYVSWPIADDTAKIEGDVSAVEALYRAVSHRVSELAELLRGEGAD